MSVTELCLCVRTAPVIVCIVHRDTDSTNMPRSVTVPGEFTVNLVLLRGYLRRVSAVDGDGILRDAFHHLEPAALDLLHFCLALRSNPRSTRGMREVRDTWQRVSRPRHTGAVPRWYSVLSRQLMSLYRLYRKMALPVRRGHESSHLTQQLSRASRRQLGHSGTVVAELPPLRSQAASAARLLWNSLVGRDVVLWLDNWYWERFTTDVATPVRSQDVSVLAVLPMLSTAEGPAARTRARVWDAFPGHVSLLLMTNRVAIADTFIRRSFGRLCDKSQALVRCNLTGAAIRVPLDIARPQRARLQWRSLSLSQWKVGTTVELIQLLEDVTAIQQHVGRAVPLLVDEKVHYALCRLMYNRGYQRWNVCTMLKDVPLLYGAWHPYKHCLTLVYRKFFPVLALLESQHIPTPDTTFKASRRVMFMEKMFASLLLLPVHIREAVTASLMVPTSHAICGFVYHMKE